MREIKFRAWDKRNKRMFEVKSLSPGLYIGVELPEKNIGNILAPYELRSIEDIELMQFTGLKDRNGREIYEGDILTCLGYSSAQVHFKDGAFHVGALPLLNFNNVLSEDFEVIGNIYENPELLKD